MLLTAPINDPRTVLPRRSSSRRSAPRIVSSLLNLSRRAGSNERREIDLNSDRRRLLIGIGSRSAASRCGAAGAGAVARLGNEHQLQQVFNL
jgi:hypothetical protein